MESGNIKLFKAADGGLFIFFLRGGTLYAKEYTKDFSAKVSVVSDDVLEGFSLCDDKNKAVIAARKQNGDIFAFREINGRWSEKLLMKSNPSDNIKCAAASDNSSFNMLYNVPIAKTGMDSLNIVSFSDGRWHNPVVIDTVMPFERVVYKTARINDSYMLVFYRTKENQLVFRELSLQNSRAAKEIAVFGSRVQMVDFSAVVFGNLVHIAAVVKGRYGYQIVYKRFNEDGFSSTVLWEERRIESCIVFVSDGRVWVMCGNGKSIFCTYSEDGGVTFCPIYNFKNKIRKTVKAEVVDLESGKNKFGEVYTYADAPNEVVAVDEICGDFIPENCFVKAAENYENVDVYKNKLEYYEKELKEANRKIEELTQKLSIRNEEVSIINSRWQNRYNALKNERQNPPQEESAQ